MLCIGSNVRKGMKYKVSVIIPFFNALTHIEECAKSIINQTLEDIEILFVDDFSTDGTKEYLLNISQDNPKIKIIDNLNKGAANARNLGIKLAAGEYLSFLDADDVFDLNMLEEMYEKSKTLNLDILICPWRYLGENKEIKKGLTLPSHYKEDDVFNHSTYPNSIFQLTSPNAWSKIYARKFILNENRRFQSLTSCNDIYFSYTSLVAAKRIGILNQSFVSYRYNSNSSISSSRGKQFRNLFLALEHIREYLKEVDKLSTLRQSYLKRSLDCLAYECQFIPSYALDDFANLASDFISTGSNSK